MADAVNKVNFNTEQMQHCSTLTYTYLPLSLEDKNNMTAMNLNIDISILTAMTLNKDISILTDF